MTNGNSSSNAASGSTSGSQRAQASTSSHTIKHNTQTQPQAQATGSLFSFSVHQPYTNWPLHAPSTAHYAPSWYAVSPQSYGAQQAYAPALAAHRIFRESGVQTDGTNGKGKERAELPYMKHWDAALTDFLRGAGLHQTLAGFQEDMMLLNADWERQRVPLALMLFVKDILDIQDREAKEANTNDSVNDRKLPYVQTQTGMEAQTPSNTTKAISQLLKQSRKRNDASNRLEFLQSTAEKRQRLSNLGENNSGGVAKPPESTSSITTMDKPMEVDSENSTPSIMARPPSCARTDAKPQNRDLQMKYDIAKNEDGPLKRTIKRSVTETDKDISGSQSLGILKGDEVIAEAHPGLAGRFKDIEDHLAVRYVPTPPRSLLDRIKFLEDHIIDLEKKHPPWAALHFNQPNRGWPPPPRPTPIIVPPHMASIDSSAGGNVIGNTNNSQIQTPQISSLKGSGAKIKSSLHRAVMEKLEIQRAKGDLASTPT